MSSLVRRCFASAALCAAVASVAGAQVTAFALTTAPNGAQQLVRFAPSSPNSVTTVGLTGVRLVGIDFRPATNQLYGYDGDKLYLVNLSTGVASVAFDVGDISGPAAFDVNPVPDRIRVIGLNGTNLRLNPLDGATITDGAYTFAMGDVNFGRVPAFSEVAYTNSDTDPATGTTLFGIDASLGQLIRIAAPNGGAVNTVGSLGIGPIASIGGFDILTLNGVNTAYFTAMLSGAMSSQLFTVNLDTGAASLVGDVAAMGGVQGLALTAVPEPATSALLLAGLLGIGAVARRRRTR
jgi:hypothetical protein